MLLSELCSGLKVYLKLNKAPFCSCPNFVRVLLSEFLPEPEQSSSERSLNGAPFCLNFVQMTLLTPKVLPFCSCPNFVRVLLSELCSDELLTPKVLQMNSVQVQVKIQTRTEFGQKQKGNTFGVRSVRSETSGAKRQERSVRSEASGAKRQERSVRSSVQI